MNAIACFSTVTEIFSSWQNDVLHGHPPTRYPIGEGELANFEIVPQRLVLLGGAPAAGKTAFAMQSVLDALRLTPGIKALVCNVEMSPQVLLERQLARLSGVDAAE